MGIAPWPKIAFQTASATAGDIKNEKPSSETTFPTATVIGIPLTCKSKNNPHWWIGHARGKREKQKCDVDAMQDIQNRLALFIKYQEADAH